MTSDMSTGSCTTWPASSRVRSTKSPTRVDNSSICASTSARRSTISCSGSRGAPGSIDAISSSTLVRSDVSGVRNSCPASVTSRACRSRDSASARSIKLNASVSLANSSLPKTGMGRRSSVRATRSAASVRRADRPQPSPGDHPAGHRGERHPDAADDQQHPAQFGHHRFGGLAGSWRSAANCRWAGGWPGFVGRKRCDGT